MDTIIILPPKNQIPPEALAEFQKLANQIELGEEYDSKPIQIEDHSWEETLWMYSREGTSKTPEAWIELAQQNELPIIVHLDGSNASWCESQDLSFVTWYNPETKQEKGMPSGHISPTIRYTQERVQEILDNPKKLEEFQQDKKFFEKMGIK